MEDTNDKYSKTRGHIAREFAEVSKTAVLTSLDCELIVCLQVLTNLWSSQYKSISASDLKSRVGRAKSEFAGRDQQDSHEFLLSLLEWLHDDTNKVRRETFSFYVITFSLSISNHYQVAKPNNMPEQNSTDKRDVMAARRHWRNYLERNQSIIVQLFCGQTRLVRSAIKCRNVSIYICSPDLW